MTTTTELEEQIEKLVAPEFVVLALIGCVLVKGEIKPER